METLREFIDLEIKQASRLFEKQGSVELMFIGQMPDGNRVAVMAPNIGSDHDKDRALAAVRKLFAEHGVIRYAVLAEAWMVVLPKGTDIDTRPSEHPERVEAVFVTARDGGGAGIDAYMKIIRDANGNGTLAPPEIIEGAGSIGRLTDLLPPTNQTHH